MTVDMPLSTTHTHYHRPPSQAITQPSPTQLSDREADNSPLTSPQPKPDLPPFHTPQGDPVPPRASPVAVSGNEEAQHVSPCETSTAPKSLDEGSDDDESLFVEEVPAAVTSQVLDSRVLLSASSEDLSSSDVETDLSADPPIEESLEIDDIDDDEDEESLSLDGSIAYQLDDLMSKLREASSVEYKLSSSNRVLSDFPNQTSSILMYEDLPYLEPELVQQK